MLSYVGWRFRLKLSYTSLYIIGFLAYFMDIYFHSFCPNYYYYDFNNKKYGLFFFDFTKYVHAYLKVRTFSF